MARNSGITQHDGITLGDIRQWLSEVTLPDSVYVRGKTSFKGKVTNLHAQEDEIKEGDRP